MNFYQTLIYNPLLNILIFFYQTISFNDLGLAIIFLTILIRILLYPLSNKMFKTQTILQKLQPEIKIIQQKYKKDPQKQLQETLAIYKKYNINPFSMYFFIFIQIPILIALYKIFSQNFEILDFNNLYNFVSRPQNINLMFLGLINLAKPSIIIAGLAAVFQFWQIYLSFKVLKDKKHINKIALYLGPIATFIFLYYLSSAIGLYWLTTNIISVINQFFINKNIEKEDKI
ncbi:MAG: YidC/Oxa1 family membrane protein insertase [bacterium]|nr:YidC/Oxa1 family membrane protein insertase [Patescibacteria group bacterium]MDW8279905.1 YidC/Oxa1 family membrane protein insertase [bacterium]